MACPASEQFRKAHIVFFRQTRQVYLRIKNKKKSFPVFRINILFRILTVQFRDTLPARDQVFLCRSENRPDTVFPVVDQDDPLIHIIKMTDIFIQTAGILCPFSPGQIGNPDQHTVPVPGLRPATGFHFIIFFAGSKEHLPVTAHFDRINQRYHLIRNPVIRLGLVQHRLVQGKVEHLRTGNGIFKSSVIIQDAEGILGKFHQRQRDTVEFSGRNNSFMFFPGQKGNCTEHIDHTQIIVILPVLGDFDPDSLLPKILQRLFIRHGFAEIISLDFFAADIPEKIKMFLCFHTFHQRMDKDTLRHLHDRSRDSLGAHGERPEKTHIQFNFIKIKLLEGIQGGIGAAEIVHPYLVASRPEPVHNSLQELLLLGHDAFSNLKVDKLMRDMVLTDDLIRDGENVAKGKVQS